MSEEYTVGKTRAARWSAQDAPSLSGDEKERIMKRVQQMDFTQEAELLRVISHPVRLQIIYGLSEVGECSVKDIWSCLGLPQSNVSQHLNLMKGRGLIGAKRRGVEVHYYLKDPALRDLIQCIMRHREGKQAS